MGEKYPSEFMLDFFQKYDILKGELDYFLSEVEGEWWASDLGFKKSHKEYGVLLQLHTFGWSGNEDIIDSLERNKTFWAHLRRSKDGGHFWFVFPNGEKIKKQDKRSEIDKTRSKFQRTVNALNLQTGHLMDKLRKRKAQARIHHAIHHLLKAEVGKDRFAEIVNEAIKMSRAGGRLGN